ALQENAKIVGIADLREIANQPNQLVGLESLDLDRGRVGLVHLESGGGGAEMRGGQLAVIGGEERRSRLVPGRGKRLIAHRLGGARRPIRAAGKTDRQGDGVVEM